MTEWFNVPVTDQLLEEAIDNKTYLVVYDCSVVPREPVLRVLKETYNQQLSEEIEDKMFDLDEEWR